jgi:GGDEF domain-containing protein
MVARESRDDAPEALAKLELTARADAALYRAEREGRGVVVFSEEAEGRSSLTGP